MLLLTETNTRKVEVLIRGFARLALRIAPRDMQTDFEHGQWWITDKRTGEQWAVNDCEPGTFDFEQVTEASRGVACCA